MPSLLSNASATGASANWGGGVGVFMVSGTFGGGTVSLQFQGPDGTTWITAGPDTSLTANGAGGFVLPPGRIRALVSGGTPSALYAQADLLSRT